MNEKNVERSGLCRLLKGKTPYGSLEGGNIPWLLLEDAATIYWCLGSSGASGPDNGLIDPRLCTKGRACYEPNEHDDKKDA